MSPPVDRSQSPSAKRSLSPLESAQETQPQTKKSPLSPQQQQQQPQGLMEDLNWTTDAQQSGEPAESPENNENMEEELKQDE
jgi:hypothetical protein